MRLSRCASQIFNFRYRARNWRDYNEALALVVRTVVHLSLRAMQGFLESVVRLMEVDLPVPAYSMVCRRHAGVEPRLQVAPHFATTLLADPNPWMSARERTDVNAD